MVRCLSFLLVIIIAAVSGPNVLSQPVQVSVRWMDEGPDDPHGTISADVGKAIRSEASLRGLLAEQHGLLLNVRAETHASTGAEFVMVSIVETMLIPESIIEAGAKHEIWYAGKPLPENTAEGRAIRQYVTRDYLRSQGRVHRVSQLVFAPGDLNRAVSTYLEELVHRFECMTPEGCP